MEHTRLKSRRIKQGIKVKKNIITKSILLAIVLPFLFQCSPEVKFKDTHPGINEFIYETMKDVYLWNDKIPDVNYADYTTPEELYDALLYKERDKWSYMYKIDNSLDLEYNEKYGFGLYLLSVKENNVWNIRIGYVNAGSPSTDAGIKRGDTVLSIDGIMLSGIADYDECMSNLEKAFNGKSKISLIYKDISGTENTVVLNKEKFNSQRVFSDKIITSDDRRIGYFAYTEFAFAQEPYNQDNELNTYRYNDLDTVFRTFSGITDLVIDLRYNGGGVVDVSRHLASLIYNKEGEIFQKSYTNGRTTSILASALFNSSFNYYFYKSDYYLTSLMPKYGTFTDYFDSEITPIGIKRVFFITTGGTASASESLINSLKPYIDVQLVGTTTHGKCVGMMGFTYENYVFYPIMFRGYNSEGYGDFYDGFNVNSEVADNMDYQLGDVNEPCLEEIINYIKVGEYTNKPSTISTTKSQSVMPVPLSGFNRTIGMY
ncbi:MAG: hypothetical protein A2015_17305 [Spirochaetes bacterium GWF1_31_7]|nr:MAG: hypothetical protein A2Y30_14615 [Spirochaetes bacterium GWE1_32_154]OHD46855.1 MAG: hypothetical protein A2015_17305 [Spirochaetes bacterium GWF1_31_7]OHD50187.1 MAG: hypothetical protein A2Y29_12660 [Spirochaetes bacterium GWE2_31_10]OHD81968.1 MAG: hypothetical protein A2355_02010 [Spirochaetes bacterium RIFOXYB1_FULL_32_8]HBD94033.1 hypothetical protein [Spirochaetia bacterium]